MGKLIKQENKLLKIIKRRKATTFEGYLVIVIAGTTLFCWYLIYLIQL